MTEQPEKAPAKKARTKKAVAKTTAKKTTAKKTIARKTTAKRTSTRRRTTSTTRRRSTPTTASAVGTAIGTLVVAWLLDLSWWARIGLVVVALVLVLGYFLWRGRQEILAGADPEPESAEAGSVEVDRGEPGPTNPGPAADPGSLPPAGSS